MLSLRLNRCLLLGLSVLWAQLFRLVHLVQLIQLRRLARCCPSAPFHLGAQWLPWVRFLPLGRCCLLAQQNRGDPFHPLAL